jgi:quaternary ammonium compound-resistance protein SugE
MAWLYLLVAGVFEIAWAVLLKQTHGFTRLWPSVWTLAAMSVSVLCLSLAVRTIPIGTGYAIWTGIGAVGVAAFGMAFYGESTAPARLLFLALIVIGMVGLKATAG